MRKQFSRELTKELGAGLTLLLPYMVWLLAMLFVVALASQWVAFIYRNQANTVTKPCILKELNLTGGAACPISNPKAFADSKAVLRRVANEFQYGSQNHSVDLIEQMLRGDWEDAITAYQYNAIPWTVVLVNVPIGFSLIIFFLLVDRFASVRAKDLERDAVGPSAFACHMQGFPTDAAKTTKAKVRKFAEQWGEVDKIILCKNDRELPELHFALRVVDFEIERVGFLLSLYDTESAWQMLKRLLTVKDVLSASPQRWVSIVWATLNPNGQLTRLHNERRQIVRKMHKVRAKLQRSFDYTGDAIVVYTRPTDAEDVDNSLATIPHKVMSLFYVFQTCMRSKYLFDEEYPIISWRCAEPQDINWVNIKYTWKQRIAFRILGFFKLWAYLLGGTVLSLGGHTILLIVNETSLTGLLLSHFVSFSVSCVVFLARRGVKKVATEECHLTKTAERASSAQNFVLLSIALNVACAGLPYIGVPGRWIDPDMGLIPQIMRQILYAGIVEPVIELSKVVIRQRALKKNVKKAENQHDLRNAFLRPAIETEDIITHVAQFLAVAFAFFPAVPFSVTYACMAMGATLLIDLLRIFKINRKPSFTSSAILGPTLVVMLFVVYMYAVGAVLVFVLYRPGNSWVGAIIGAIFFLLIAVSLVSPLPYAAAALFELALTCSKENQPKRAPRGLFKKTAPVPGKPSKYIPGTSYRKFYKDSRNFSNVDQPAWSACVLQSNPAKDDHLEVEATIDYFMRENPKVRIKREEMPPIIRNEEQDYSSDSDVQSLGDDADSWDTVSSEEEGIADSQTRTHSEP